LQPREGGKFGKAAKPSEFEANQDFDPIEQNIQSPLIVKSALLFAIKQNLVTAADLGIERLGTVWKRLYTASIAILERQTELEN
jgi:hypothetical protein